MPNTKRIVPFTKKLISQKSKKKKRKKIAASSTHNFHLNFAKAFFSLNFFFIKCIWKHKVTVCTNFSYNFISVFTTFYFIYFILVGRRIFPTTFTRPPYKTYRYRSIWSVTVTFLTLSFFISSLVHFWRINSFQFISKCQSGTKFKCYFIVYPHEKLSGFY